MGAGALVEGGAGGSDVGHVCAESCGWPGRDGSGGGHGGRGRVGSVAPRAGREAQMQATNERSGSGRRVGKARVTVMGPRMGRPWVRALRSRVGRGRVAWPSSGRGRVGSGAPVEGRAGGSDVGRVRAERFRSLSREGSRGGHGAEGRGVRGFKVLQSKAGRELFGCRPRTRGVVRLAGSGRLASPSYGSGPGGFRRSGLEPDRTFGCRPRTRRTVRVAESGPPAGVPGPGAGP